MQHKQKLLNRENNWNELKNYKPNDVVSDDGKLWQNVSGINTKPGSLSNNDWIVIDDSIDYAKIEFVNDEIDKIKDFATAGIVGSINPSTVTTDLIDGVYNTQISGTYTNAGNIVVKDGYYTLLRKTGTDWSLESETKMPMLSPTGKVEEGNTEAVSGGEVYNKIEVINDLIANFSGQIGSGIIGEALPETIPISEGFGIYTVSTAGTFVNFKDVNNTPLIVSQSDLDSGLVQLWGNNNIWEKHVTLVDVFTPVFSDNLSDI